MENKTLDKVIKVLETAEDFYVPARKLWKDLSAEGFAVDAYEAFLTDLGNDERFDVRNITKKTTDDEKEMEEAGIYTGPRVKLRARQMSKEDMERVTLKHAQRIIDNLVKAYDVRSKNLSPEEEDEMLTLMQKAKKMKEEIKRILDTDKNP